MGLFLQVPLLVMEMNINMDMIMDIGTHIFSRKQRRLPFIRGRGGAESGVPRV